MPTCPICASDDVICSGHPRYFVDGRATAMCPHGEAHARAGYSARPVQFFAETAELLEVVQANPCEVIHAAGIPMGVQEEGREFSAPFLDEFCGVRGLTKSLACMLAVDPDLCAVLPKPKMLDESEKEGWPILLTPLFGPSGLTGVEMRYFCPQPNFRPGDSPLRGPGRVIKIIGHRGVYITDPYSSPRAVVLFEGPWDAIAGRYDAFHGQNGEFVFAAISANTSAKLVRDTLKHYFPQIPVVGILDRDRPGVQAMARLRRHFPTAVLSGLNDENGKGPKDYREADPCRRWDALLMAVESGIEEWDRRRLGADPDGRIEIAVRPPEYEVAGEAMRAIRGRGIVYLRGQRIVYIWHQRGPKKKGIYVPVGSPIIVEANPPWLRDHLSQAVKFLRETHEGLVNPCLVPEWLPAMLLASSHTQSLPSLLAVVETPVFLMDGTILDEPGFDSESGLYYAPLNETLPVDDFPSFQDAVDARDLLFSLVVDFPFASIPRPEAHRAAWLALVLTICARYAITGPTPFVLLDSTAPGSGKFLLTEVSGLIGTGRDLPVSIAPSEGEELKKMALALLRAGHRVVYLDEAKCPWGNSDWCGLITAYPTYEGRILGVSTMLALPQNTLWVVSGNNVSLTTDATRRCLQIRLEPLVDRPEDRDDFVITDLLAHVREHQAELIHAALTILRAFHVAGRPQAPLRAWGSFEAWSSLIRQAVNWVSGVDCDTREVLSDRADSNRNAMEALLHGLHGIYNIRPFTVQDLLQRYEAKGSESPDLWLALDNLNPNPGGLNAKTLGRLLARCYRIVAGGHFLDRVATKRNGSCLWIMRDAPTAGLATAQAAG